DDKDLVHEFVQNDGLACLIKVGSEADQNYQNYILRALGQVMLYVDGMNGVIEHNETIQWLYSLISSKFRLVVKTALKLLLVFVEYTDTNCRLLVEAVDIVDSERGVKSWYNIINLLNDKDCADMELLIFAMTLINKTLAGIPDQDTYYDIVDSLEEQGMEKTIQYYMSKQGVEIDLLKQFQIYEAVLRQEDGEDLGDCLPFDAQRQMPRSKTKLSLTSNSEDRRKSRRHSLDTTAPKANLKKHVSSDSLPSWQRKVLETTEQFNKKNTHLNGTTTITKAANGSTITQTSGLDDITPGLRRRRERDARNRTLIKEQSDYNLKGQRASISSCSSADSYGSTSSGASSAYSLGSNEEKSPLIETIKLVPSSLDKNRNNFSNQSNNKIIEEELNKRNQHLLKPQTASRPTSLMPTNATTTSNNNHYPLNKQNSISDKKSWMLSMMYGKSQEQEQTNFSELHPTINNVSRSKSPTSPKMWTPISNSTSVSPSHEVISGSSIGVKNIQEKILKSPSHETKYQSSVKTTSSSKDLKSPQEYLQWEQLMNTLSRPLLINDLDFTDLKSDDDNDIFQVSLDTRDGSSPLPPPPPPPGGFAPPPPPMPVVDSPPPPPFSLIPRTGFQSPLVNNRSESTPSPTPSEKIVKNKKTVKLFWKEVKEEKSLLSRLKKKKTIWDEIKPVPVDTEKLEHLFENRSKELSNKKTQDGKKSEIIILDTKRSNAINIGMTKLPPPRTIKTAILKMNSTIMSREGIEKILTTMMPTEEEKTKITEAQMANPDIPLGSAENFLLTLSSISALEARLRLWAFRLDYDLMEKEIAEQLMDLKQAMVEIEKSDNLRLILATLLSIGNFLNGCQVKGFQIEYLSKVPEVKDTVHKHSLLHHLCHIVMEKYPSSGDLYSEFGAVTRASRVDFDEVAKNIQKLEQDCKASWDYLKVIAKHDGSSEMKVKMSEFLTDCAERIIVLGIIQRRVLNRFKKLLLFLGFSSISAKETKPHEVLKIISEFALEYRTTRERVKEQMEKKANHRARNKTRGKMITETEKFRTKEQQADQELRQLLGNGYGDYESDMGSGGKWGTLPGVKTRQRFNNNYTTVNNNTINGKMNSSDNHDEILETLVKTASMRNDQKTKRKSTRYGDRKSLRRTLKSGLELTEEELMNLENMTTS
ncbi:FH1/FH2 domain-containing protein 3-like isoform X3, partial [Dinothrombium tinctorium]